MKSFFDVRVYAPYASNITICDLNIDDVSVGNVNINNRIFTQGAVTELGKNKYKITPFVGVGIFGSFVSEASKGETIKSSDGRTTQVITATVDGVKYKGAEIIVDNKIVSVDGRKVNAPFVNPPESKEIASSESPSRRLG